MQLSLRSILLASALLLSACGEASEGGDADLVVEPHQFVLIPCGQIAGERPCALASVGGKRILFGAPAGVTSALSSDDLKLLDAVMLFSLRASDTNGLAEVRNRSWEAGRASPLLVIGPSGVAAFAAGLNKAYEMADALRIVEEGIPSGGYDAALLRTNSGPERQTVFNTGDVVVMRTSAGYSVDYLETTSVWLSSCKSDVTPQADFSISCDPDADTYAWPLKRPIFVKE